MNNLYLELGYNWKTNYTKQNVEYVIFSVMFTNGRFTDCVASEKYYKDSQFPDSIKVRVNIDNLEDAEKEYVLRELNAGNVKQFAYDDEPDKTYNYAIADIKPFVMSHLNDAVRRLKMNKHMPDWQKDKIMKILGNMKKNIVKINENTLRQIVAESVKKVLKEGIDRSKYETEFRNAINIITSHVDCETPKIGRDENGYSYCDIEFPSISMSLRLYCYNEETGELGARLDDEYGTNMYDYVCAAQGAPLGYITDRTGKGLAQKIVSDIHSIEKSFESEY